MPLTGGSLGSLRLLSRGLPLPKANLPSLINTWPLTGGSPALCPSLLSVPVSAEAAICLFLSGSWELRRSCSRDGVGKKNMVEVSLAHQGWLCRNVRRALLCFAKATTEWHSSACLTTGPLSSCPLGLWWEWPQRGRPRTCVMQPCISRDARQFTGSEVRP